jgi:hypothetical protein
MANCPTCEGRLSGLAGEAFRGGLFLTVVQPPLESAAEID